MEPINPYNERGLIRQHEKFFGRGRELREVFSNLRNMQSVSIVGQRRIGKSSFLYRIARPQASELNGSFELHYLDLQRIFSVEAFYERACGLLGREDGASPLDLEEAIENRQVVRCA
jgi:AAA+ ATPase superfamily predicted ATPase